MGPSTPFLTPHLCLHCWQTHCGLSHGLRRNGEVLSVKIYSGITVKKKKRLAKYGVLFFIGVLCCTKATQLKSLKSSDDSGCANEKI